MNRSIAGAAVVLCTWAVALAQGGNEWADSNARISPDGKSVVFQSTRDGQTEIYVADIDSGKATRLTRGLARDEQPEWLDRGRRIAFWSTRDGQFSPWVMDADGANVERYAFQTSQAVPGLAIVHARSRRAAFTFIDADGDMELGESKYNGREFRRLTDNTALDHMPSWSPDGTRIVFSSLQGGSHDIYVAHVDTQSVTRLTTSQGNDLGARFSPDGTTIAFQSDRDGSAQTYLMNADGSDPRRLTDGEGVDAGPVWSPDGEWLLVASGDTEASTRLVRISSDGEELGFLLEDDRLALAEAQEAARRAAQAGADADDEQPEETGLLIGLRELEIREGGKQK